MSAKPFTWVVQFTVDPMWVADGFTIDDLRALDMLAKECGYADVNTELSAKVLHAPEPMRIAKAQGYTGPGPDAARGALIFDLREGTKSAGKLKLALVAAQRLLDSVAFVADEGDTAKPLRLIEEALAQLEGVTSEEVEA